MQKLSERIHFYIGADLSKDTFCLALWHQGEVKQTQSFASNVEGFSQALNWLASQGAVAAQSLICLEHIGVYAEKFCLVFHGAGYDLWKVSALRLANIQLSPDRLKSDPADANKIARFCHRFIDQAQLYQPDSEEIRQLKHLIRHRKQLVAHRQKAINQAKSYQQEPFPMAEILSSFEEQIQGLTTRIQLIEQQLKDLIEQQAKLKQIFDILISIPGIGPVIARQLILITKGFTQINCHKKLAAFAGTAPYENSSGKNTKWKKRSLSKKANKQLKPLLTAGVMSAIRPNAFWGEYYQKLLKRPGMQPFQAINIIRNRLLKIAVKLVQKQTSFDRELYINNCKSWSKNLILS